MRRLSIVLACLLVAVSVLAGDPHPAEALTPSAAAAIAGRVLEEGTGKPVVGASIVGHDPWSQHELRATTDINGYYTLSSMVDLASGATEPLATNISYGVYAYSDDHETGYAYVSVYTAKTYTANFTVAKRIRGGSLYLSMGSRVMPFNGWKYFGVYSQDAGGLHLVASVTGLYSVLHVDVPAGEYYVWGYADPLNPVYYPNAYDFSGAQKVTVADNSEQSLHLGSENWGLADSSNAYVYDEATGDPIQGINVSFGVLGPGGDDVWRRGPYVTDATGMADISTLIANVWVKFEDPSGVYGFQYYEGRSAPQKRPGALTWSAATPGRVVEFEAHLGKGGTLSGTLRDANGDPVVYGLGYDPHEATLWGQGDPGYWYALETVKVSKQGTFEFKGVPAGTFRVSATLFDETHDTLKTAYHAASGFPTAVTDGADIVFDPAEGLSDLNVSFNVDVPAAPVAQRYAGASRYETAVRISRATYRQSDNVILVTGDKFPDALAATGLAGRYRCPILLLKPGTVIESVTEEIIRLKPKTVHMIGMYDDRLERILLERIPGVQIYTTRGNDRYETASYIANMTRSAESTTTAFVVRGDSFADALSIGPVAYAAKAPIYLVMQNEIPDVIKRGMIADGIERVVIVGSEAAISRNVATSLASVAAKGVTRVGGKDRYDTSRLVAEWGLARGIVTSGYVGLATGTNFPDALGGGAAAGQRGGVLLLTNPLALSAPTATFLDARATATTIPRVYGSSAAVSDNVLSAFAARAR